MPRVRGNHRDIQAWLGDDLWHLALKAWKETSSREAIVASLRGMPGLRDLPPAVLQGAVDQVEKSVQRIEEERIRVKRSRPWPAAPWCNTRDKIRFDLQYEMEQALFGWPGFDTLSNISVDIVSDDREVCVGNFENYFDRARQIKELSLVVMVRAGSKRRIWDRELGVFGKRVNLELRPIETVLHDFEGFAAIWIEFEGVSVRRWEGVFLKHHATGAVRYGDDITSALDDPVGWKDAMPFIRKAIQPLDKQDKMSFRAKGFKSHRELRLPSDLAERYRAHLIWIGHQIGGPLGKLFKLLANKGYRPHLYEDGASICSIDQSYEIASFCDYSDNVLTSNLDNIASLPEITFAQTAHEALAGKLFRNSYGEEGLEFQPKRTRARATP